MIVKMPPLSDVPQMVMRSVVDIGAVDVVATVTTEKVVVTLIPMGASGAVVTTSYSGPHPCH